MAGKRSKSSERWLRRQQRDPFARAARKDGHVSRAHFKLKELDDRFRLIRGDAIVLELGAAPGGWTNYIESRLSNKGTLIAVDPLPITSGAHTVAIQGEAGEPETDALIADTLGSMAGRLDLVLSDMAPNMSGVRAVDQARSMALADVALEACQSWAKPGSGLALKAFQGEGFDAWVANLRQAFAKVQVVKPKSSRSDSREVFVVAQGYKAAQDV